MITAAMICPILWAAAPRILTPYTENIFTLLQSAMVVFAAVMQTGILWSLAETVNGLMAIPNLILLAALSPELRKLTCEYKKFYG